MKAEKNPSGAKARADVSGFGYGLKPEPFTRKHGPCTRKPGPCTPNPAPSGAKAQHHFAGSMRGLTPPPPSVLSYAAGRAASSRLNHWLRAVQAGALAVCVCFSLGATDASSRFNDLGHRLMCTCGCAQLLGECNHVGCPNSGGMRDELSAGIADGASDEKILASFAVKYGATVLAAPTTQGFDLLAWVAPFAVLAAGILGTVLLVRRWSIKTAGAETGGAAMVDPASMEPAARALRDKIRQETGGDGGS